MYVYIFIIIYTHTIRKSVRIRILRYDTRIYIFVFVSQYLRYITAPYNVSCNPVVIEGIFVPVSTISFKLARNWIHPLSIVSRSMRFENCRSLQLRVSPVIIIPEITAYRNF